MQLGVQYLAKHASPYRLEKPGIQPLNVQFIGHPCCQQPKDAFMNVNEQGLRDGADYPFTLSKRKSQIRLRQKTFKRAFTVQMDNERKGTHKFLKVKKWDNFMNHYSTKRQVHLFIYLRPNREIKRRPL